MRKILLAITCVGTFLLLESRHPAVAQELQIINDDTQSVLYFLYSPNGERWEEYEIDPSDSWTLSCGRNTRISIYTNAEAYVNYALECENRYVLYWNAGRGLWDVARVR